MAQDPQAEKKENNAELSLTSLYNNTKGEIPIFGLGTYIQERTSAHYESGLQGTHDKDEDATMVDSIACALKNGYIHIDSAQIYDTERLVMEGIKKGGKERKDIWITSKLSPTIQKSEDAQKHIEKSIEYLGGYIDLFLIHAPSTGNGGKDVRDCYKVMMHFHKQGKLKHIGVSNFNTTHLKLFEQCGLTKPYCNQIELHPFLREKDIVEYCIKNNILIEAYSPIAKAKKMDNEILKKCATKHKKSVAQIMIRWSLQQGYITLPKSTNSKRIVENSKVFDFKLDNDDLKNIDTLAKENFRSTGWEAIKTVWKEEHFVNSDNSKK